MICFYHYSAGLGKLQTSERIRLSKTCAFSTTSHADHARFRPAVAIESLMRYSRERDCSIALASFGGAKV
jgi:hypothetical protein